MIELNEYERKILSQKNNGYIFLSFEKKDTLKNIGIKNSIKDLIYFNILEYKNQCPILEKNLFIYKILTTEEKVQKIVNNSLFFSLLKKNLTLKEIFEKLKEKNVNIYKKDIKNILYSFQFDEKESENLYKIWLDSSWENFKPLLNYE